MNRYGSIMERITAQQEASDREDGDAIRREAAVDAEDTRVRRIMWCLDSETELNYALEFLDEKELSNDYQRWLFDAVKADSPAES